MTGNSKMGSERVLSSGLWTVVVYHASLAVIALLISVGSLFVLVLNPLEFTTLIIPPLAFMCTVSLGWIVWGLAHCEASAFIWACRFHFLIMFCGGIVGLGGLAFICTLGGRGDAMIGATIIFVGIVAPALLVAATSWACWRLLRKCENKGVRESAGKSRRRVADASSARTKE